MSLIRFSVRHGQTLDEARRRMETSVAMAHSQFGAMIQRTEWTTDRNGVRLLGVGFEIDLRVDSLEVHVTADAPFLGQLLGGPLTAGLKQIVSRSFQKQLT